MGSKSRSNPQKNIPQTAIKRKVLLVGSYSVAAHSHHCVHGSDPNSAATDRLFILSLCVPFISPLCRYKDTSCV